MLQFIRATKGDYLTLSADSLHNVRWWVDAACAVHPDMKSHAGGGLSLGAGIIYGTSKCQKLNAKSSSEAEIVGTDDVMPQILWTLCFLEAQGHKIDDNVLCQDNKNSMLLETNGRGSSGKRTRHVVGTDPNSALPNRHYDCRLFYQGIERSNIYQATGCDCGKD
jgi:hypothetical protein